MINRTILVGRVTKDPELYHTSSNISYTRFTLAVNRTYRGASGELEADFIKCIAWRKQAENVCKYVTKGYLVGVEGRIETGSYEKDGRTIYTTEVVCDSVQFISQPTEQPRSKPKPQPKEQSLDITEDDLPF